MACRKKLRGWNALHIESCGKNLIYIVQVRRQQIALVREARQRERRLVYRADRLVCYAQTPSVRFVELLCPQQIS